MEYLGIEQAQLETAGGYWTAREIAQQPEMWNDIERLLAHDAARLRAFLHPLLGRQDLRIVLSGAGTSAFVGECLAPALNQAGLSAVAVSTTDLVAAPDRWLNRVPTLLVSFARSGNSPESVAALQLAEQRLSEGHQLIFTCNPDGALCRRGRDASNAHVVVLPEQTNDRGFAMTSSFTGMLLAAASAFGLMREVAAASLATWGGELLDAAIPFTATLARSGFERVIFLGSNECKGLAREAALKMLELSDGRIVTLAETPLGFRHGPKTIVNSRTLVVLFVCNDPHTRRYDLDMLKELRADAVAARVVALGAASAERSAAPDQIDVRGAASAPDLALCLVYALFAQVLAFQQSLACGLRPDLPNRNGVVSRVVQGFTIYPWSAE
jgi:tagatose-6-phosphate ketose/aldose isomerase